LKDAQTVTAIILIAGNSTRFGKNRNKNFEIIEGKNVLTYSLNEFDNNKYIDNIIIACKSSEIEKVKEILTKEKISKKVDIIIGGNTRKQSVCNCLKSTNSDIVIIHDGARPLIKQEYINKCIENINEFKGVTIGVKSKDTIKITDENNTVIETTSRNNTWIIQTPQCFKRKILLELHKKYNNEDITDDCILLERNNNKVKVIEGDYTNIKITTYEDLNIVKEYLNSVKK
jgi:2-C-methyl-D-erythritol 4-phosphate cytidylyltransferase